MAENKGELDALTKRMEALEARVSALEGKPVRAKSAAPPSRSASKASVKSNGVPASESAASLKKREGYEDFELRRADATVRAGEAQAERRRSLSKSASKPDINRRSSLEKGPEIDPARVGSYKVGKRSVYYVVPANAAEYKSEPQDKPSSGLQLEYAYGYNGKTAQNNVFFTHDGASLVYCIAGTGVKFDLAGNRQSFFTGHNEDIVSLARHPKEPLVATGQVDPKGRGKPFICIWDYNTKALKARLEGAHDRAVVALAFSPDGALLASVGADDNHTLAIWRWQDDQKKPVAEMNTSKDKVYGLTFNAHAEGGELEFATYGAKQVKLWSYKPAERSLKSNIASAFQATKVVQNAYGAVTYVKGGVAVVGTETGDLYLFKGGKFVKAVKAHQGAVSALVCLPDDAGVASAGADGNVLIFDGEFNLKQTVALGGGKRHAVAMDVSGAQLAVGCSNNSLALVDMARGQARTVMEGHSGEIWALAVHPELPIFATGALDKQLRVWDARAHSAKAEKTVALKSGVICAAFSPSGQTLAVGLENGTLQLYDFASMKLSFEKKMHKERVAAVLFSPNGQVVATGSWDQSISLLDTETKSSVTLNGHTSSVTHLTFSRDSKYLQSNSRDYEILFWDTEAGKRVERNSVADVEWHDWQCILGYPVRSVFRSGMDGTDVNACHVSHGKELVAAGDDMATVSLFRYPAAHANQASLDFAGHSSHVTNVRFSADDRYLFSTGGLDFGVFQWAVVPHN